MATEAEISSLRETLGSLTQNQKISGETAKKVADAIGLALPPEPVILDFGLDDDLKKVFNEQVSFQPLVMQWQMIRVLRQMAAALDQERNDRETDREAVMKMLTEMANGKATEAEVHPGGDPETGIVVPPTI